MSTMIVKVRTVEAVLPHPNADKLDICVLGGWKSIARKGEFKPGDLVVYFPPDSILPPALAEDPPVGRLGVAKYCSPVRDDEKNLLGHRVKATRLRGQPSFGLIMAIDPSKGDQDWPADTDVAEFYGVTKWEPPLKCEDGDSAAPSNFFHKYTDIEHFANFPDAFTDGEEVIITEKIHGKNCRMGLVQEPDENGQMTWTWMAGSHDVRRKQYAHRTSRMDAVDLAARGYLARPEVHPGQVIDKDGIRWRVDELRTVEVEEGQPPDERKLFIATQVNSDGSETQIMSEFWTFLDDKMRRALASIKEKNPLCHGVIAYGEIYGSGVQDMAYGLKNGQRKLRIFDIAVDDQYMDFDDKLAVCRDFGLETVPHLYRGPFSRKIVEELTDGPTTACDPKEAGGFKGREGVVVTPVKERYSRAIRGKRCILKNVSADYLGRKDAQDNKN